MSIAYLLLLMAAQPAPPLPPPPPPPTPKYEVPVEEREPAEAPAQPPPSDRRVVEEVALPETQIAPPSTVSAAEDAAAEMERMVEEAEEEASAATASVDDDPLAPLPPGETPKVPEPALMAAGDGCPGRGIVEPVEALDAEGNLRATRLKLCAYESDDASYRGLLINARGDISRTRRLTVASRARVLARIDEELAAMNGEQEWNAPVGR